MAENPNTPADWYADPADPTLHRWWDGTGWTDRLRPAAPLKAAAMAAQERGTHSTVQMLEVPLPPGAPLPRISARYFGDRPPPPSMAESGPRDVRDVYRRSREVAELDLYRNVRNPAATVGIVAGILTLVALALFQYSGFSFTYLFAPSVVTLTIAGVAIGRARLTGAGVARSALALLIAGPVTAVTVWAFAEQLFDIF